MQAEGLQHRFELKMKKTRITIATPGYSQFVEELKARVASARLSAARSVNSELILLYWDIGRGIAEKQKQHGWGKSVVETVAKDLRRTFPAIKGFSSANIWRMRQLYMAYSTGGNLAQAVRELVVTVPWGHHVLILGKIKSKPEMLYYLQATARFGWTRNVLLNQIKSGTYQRAVTEKKTHNFPLALPECLAEQAEEVMKSSYNLEFLGVKKEMKELELESRLVERLRDFILELGYGFCFIGRQHRLKLGKKECFVDLLFYHRFLKALVAFELKVGSFEPEHAGKMDFYLNVLNDKERSDDDNPSVGIILCAEKDDVEVEYALKTKGNPIGVAAYQLQSKLPVALKGKLPTAKQLSEVVQGAMAVKD